MRRGRDERRKGERRRGERRDIYNGEILLHVILITGN